MLSTPSLIIVPVSSSILTLLVSGTCLMGTIMFMPFSHFLTFARSQIPTVPDP